MQSESMEASCSSFVNRYRSFKYIGKQIVQELLAIRCFINIHHIRIHAHYTRQKYTLNDEGALSIDLISHLYTLWITRVSCSIFEQRATQQNQIKKHTGSSIDLHVLVVLSIISDLKIKFMTILLLLQCRIIDQLIYWPIVGRDPAFGNLLTDSCAHAFRH